MSFSEQIDELVQVLHDKERFVFTTHLTPDGDGLGSEVALARILRRAGKDVAIINCSGTPADLRFLLRSGEVITFAPNKHDDAVRNADVIIAFDLGGAGRLGRMEGAVRKSRALRIVVDHHIFENDTFDLEVIDTKSSSSAEITWQIIERFGGHIDRDIAEPLYVGLVQDTGSFNYNSTNPSTHHIAARCLEAGVNPQRIWRKLNCKKDLGRVRFMGFNISRIALSRDRRVSSVKIDLDTVRRHGVEPRDAFEVVNHLLTIDGIEVGLLALQIGSRRVKFSLRSAGRVDVYQIARDYGGGGHRYAAGFTVDDIDVEEAYQELLARVRHAVVEQAF